MGKTAERVELQPIKIDRRYVEIEGTTPLVVSRFSEKMRDEIERKQTGATGVRNKKQIRKPEEEFMNAIYFLDEPGVGEPSGFPAVGIKEAMASAAIRFMGFKYKVEVYGSLFIPGEFVEIQADFPKMRRDTVRLAGPGRTADLRYRPEYMPWKMLIPVEYKADYITLDQVVSMLSHAGFSVGLGEWRPEKGGDWGRFQVTGVE